MKQFFSRIYHSSIWGYILVALAATFWASAGIVAKYMMLHNIPAIVLAEMRVTFGSLILFIVMFISKPHLLHITFRDAAYMIILGVFGIASVHYSYYYAISKTNVATAILLQYTAPALIMIYSVVVQGETFSSKKLSALVFAFAGCFLMVGGYNFTLIKANTFGIIAGMASAVFFAFYSLCAEYGLRKYSVWTILCYGFIAASGFWWCLHSPWKVLTAHYSVGVWGLFLFLGVFSAVVPFGLYFSGLRYIKSTQASITAMLEPVVAGLCAYIFLGETMSVLQVIGASFVLVGIIVLQYSPRSKSVAAQKIKGPNNFS